MLKNLIERNKIQYFRIHNPEVEGSWPPPATFNCMKKGLTPMVQVLFLLPNIFILFAKYPCSFAKQGKEQGY